jgi:flagellar biosynthetic protein FliQ
VTTTEALVGLLREGLLLALALAAPALAGALIAGIVVGLIGAVTQVQDPSVQLVPRIAGVAVALAIASPVIAKQASAFAAHVLAVLPVIGAGS